MTGRPSRRPVQKDVDREDDDVRRIDKGYTWEGNYVRSWDQIVEDPTTGRLKSFERQEQIARKRQRDEAIPGVRRGIIRYTVFVIDTSEAMSQIDMKPSRAAAVCAACGEFVREYFDQNPISQLSVVVTRDAIAEKLSNLSSNPDIHIDAIQEALNRGPYGEASLQNSLRLARTILAPIPAYGSREVVFAFGALASCDPGNIHDDVDKLVEEKIRCSTVGLSAELSILGNIAKKTGGVYRVAMNEDHFGELLSDHVIPPPTTANRAPASLIRMGFPVLKRLSEPKQFWNNTDINPRRVGYECPRCKAWLSAVPCECVLCGLTLVSSPHLARSYHHLFPVPKYVPLKEDDMTNGTSKYNADGDVEMGGPGANVARRDTVRCTGCLKLLPAEVSLRLECPRCKHVFCLDCDTFVHDGLHHCPSCSFDDEESILARSN